MSEVITQDPKTGRLLPGNIWKAPAWRPGESGHTARYTPGRLVTVCTTYIEDRLKQEQPLTWSGLALHMGLSRKALDRYSQGEIGKDRPGIVATLDIMKSHIENQLESKLTDREHATAGVIRALQAINRDRWGEKQTVDIEVKQQISIVVDQGSVLEKRFINAGVTIDQPMKEISDD